MTPRTTPGPHSDADRVQVFYQHVPNGTGIVCTPCGQTLAGPDLESVRARLRSWGSGVMMLRPCTDTDTGGDQ